MREELILHHYEGSPYSEKIRALLGYKGLDWRSVAIAPMLPKPDLMTLTHGYRRAPVLQIGADVYCDSALIGATIERLHASPALACGARAASAELLSHWVDQDLFWRAVRYVMGLRAEQIPQSMLDDRQQMHPQMRFERATLAADLPQVAAQLRPVLALLDAALAGDVFFGGALPAPGDFGLYHPLWFLHNVGGVAALAPEAARLHAWMARMAAFGKGKPAPMTPAEAIAVALRAAPAALAPHSADAALAPGALVEVMPLGYPREAVRGRLVRLDEDGVSVALDSAATGLVHIHFPRLGYHIQASAE